MGDSFGRGLAGAGGTLGPGIAFLALTLICYEALGRSSLLRVPSNHMSAFSVYTSLLLGAMAVHYNVWNKAWHSVAWIQ